MIWLTDALRNGLRFVANLLARLPGPALDYVVIDLTGSYPERTPAPRRFFQRLLQAPWQRSEESLEALRDRLERIARAPDVKGLVLRVRALTAGMATVQSLRGAIAELRRQGKRVVAYIPSPDLAEYYLAAAADEIWMAEAGFWNVPGLRAEITFFREAFDRIGILPEFERIGEFKTAVDPFMRSELSPPHRQVVESILDSLMSEFVADVAGARRLDTASVRAAIDRAPLSADDAHAARLIDGVCYEDELAARLEPKGELALRPWAHVRWRLPRAYQWRTRSPLVGVVELLGGIIPGESREMPLPLPFVGGRLAGSETVARAFRVAERNPRVRAIVFHVDSRGGSELASNLIWREVERIKSRKPVVAFMGDVAGSGGYYVACGASRIVAQPATITGSIGVVTGKLTVRELYARLGLNREVVARGEAATVESIFRPFTLEQAERIRRHAEAIYQRFVRKVAAGRAKNEADVDAIARGRVWTGRQALERGLIDELGDFSLAVRWARELAGVPAAQEVSVVTIRAPQHAPMPSIARAFLRLGAPVASGVLAETVDAWRDIREALGEPALLIMPDLGVF
jgi:protease-4